MNNIRSVYESASPKLRKTIISLGIVGIATLISALIGIFQFLQDVSQNNQQNKYNETQISVAINQLAVQEQILSLQSNVIEKYGNLESTRIIEEIGRLRITQEILSETLSPPIQTPQYVAATVLSKITDTPSFPDIYASQDIKLNENQTGSVFNGELYISVLKSSFNDNQVNITIFTPGFPELILNRYSAGDKVNFSSTGMFEIQIISIESFYDNVNFRITYLGTTGIDSRLLSPVEIKSIKQQNTGFFYNNGLAITIDKAEFNENNYSFRISSPGEEPLIVEDKQIGYVTHFISNKTYEVRITGGNSFYSTVEIMVSKLK